ncbi:MAG: hypothetical protein M3367_07000 [Acidobacteriota bacterium]|nr:hypothetical protein [Acidobacteriota bacterium]
MFVSKPSKITVSSLIFLLVFSLQLFAQNNRHDEPISEEHYEILEKRKEFIQQEVSSDKNEWSGTYTQGDHHPTVFMWSADQGFLTWGSHHTFFPSRINFGKAEFLNNRLTIKPEISKEHLNFQYIPTELSAIKWDEQHFLIPSDKLINFAYAVHSGADSQIVQYFAKSEDYQKSRKGLPNLPKEFEKILTMKAIKPRITAVKNGDDRIFDAEITLNLGRADKLIEGMIFYHVKSSGSLSIVITDLQEESSKAKVIGIAQSVENEEIKPRVGLKFTSKVPDGYYGY